MKNDSVKRHQSLTYFLEIGLEEIPARFMPAVLADLKAQLDKSLVVHRLAFDRVQSTGTYRRLAAHIYGLADTQADETVVTRGPAVEIGKAADDTFLPPAIGFAKRLGLTAEQLEIRDEGGKSFLFAVVEKKGQDTEKILPAVVVDAIKALSPPISMRWGEGQGPFIRPVHWVVSLLGHDVVPLTVFGIPAGRTTYGHRFLTRNPNTDHAIDGVPANLSSSTDYLSTTSAIFVVANANDRREFIEDELRKHTGVRIDGDLLDEVVFLCERPTILEGRFDKTFLDLPEEVLIETMQKHQKYFPVFAKGKLADRFFFVADSATPKNRATIVAGNESVLHARLSDAQFFWEADLKTPLAEYVPLLENVVFQKNTGSVGDKVRRIEKLIFDDGVGVDLTPEQAKLVRRAVRVCKADLVTQMVKELPKLQGIMGRYYAQKSGEAESVCHLIEQHYWPRFPGDALPVYDEAKVLGIADRLDTLACCFITHLMPTGSADPWGVRRLVRGLFDLINTGPFNLELGVKNAVTLVTEKK
ncbi:MAG: glycine--tRNA ligase subunit beta, partial [Candidatus Margulisiibacteriota bacterium]